jgi:signal transduction histidine kinase
VIDLGAWCRTWLANWTDHPRAADLTVRTGPPAPARTHPALLGQILDNLLDNACKYSAPGTPIAVTVETGPSEIALTVSDRGCGIAAEDLPRVFEPFFRAGNARWLGKPGVGLGLAVVWRLVTIIGGRVEAGSEPGQGSWFRLSVPLVPPEPRAGGTREAAQARAAGWNDPGDANDNSGTIR